MLPVSTRLKISARFEAARAAPRGCALAGADLAGGRAPSARRLLLEALIRAPGHKTADELTADVQAIVPEVNRSTIYRNLEELVHLRDYGVRKYDSG